MRFLLILALVLSQGPAQQNANAGDSTKSKADSKKGVTAPLPPVVRHDAAPATQPDTYKVNTEPPHKDDLTIFFSFVLSVVAILQIVLLGRQNQLIEDQFSATFRPKLVLRRIYFTGSTENPVPKQTSVAVEMANVGGVGVAKATLHLAFGPFDAGQPVLWKLQEELAKARPLKMEIAQGGSFVVIVAFNPATQDDFVSRDVLQGAKIMYCVGYVAYSDASGKMIRRTGFIRRCDIRYRWFLPADFPASPAFEYED